MTAQVGDVYRFKEKKYNIIAWDTPIAFQPQDYGLTPEGRCSNCWNGYWCEYDIGEDEIVLNNLYINTKDGSYPDINGVSVIKEKDGVTGRIYYMGYHQYKNIGLRMNYAGRIVAGLDFIREFYIHMGYQQAWAYQTLTEFIFEEGILLDAVDHSDMAAMLREEIRLEWKREQEAREKVENKGKQKSKDKWNENATREFIEESFSLEFKDKCWWL